MANKNFDEIVKPIVITINETGEQYTLDFNREAVFYAERHDFKVDEVSEKLATGTKDLFTYAFRKNHKNVAKNRIDAVYDKLGGLTAEMIQRLLELYAQALSEGALITEEELEKNSKVTVEMM